VSKRVRLLADMGSANITVGWMEVTPTGRILEVHFPDKVAKMTAGEPHDDTRCSGCALDICVDDVVTVGAVDCLCCKSNHGKIDPNEVRIKQS
jgi:hypothetical protein